MIHNNCEPGGMAPWSLAARLAYAAASSADGGENQNSYSACRRKVCFGAPSVVPNNSAAL